MLISVGVVYRSTGRPLILVTLPDGWHNSLLSQSMFIADGLLRMILVIFDMYVYMYMWPIISFFHIEIYIYVYAFMYGPH